MYSTAKNVTLSRHSVVKVIPDNEPILADDLVRNMHYSVYSDETDYNEINKMNWQLAKDAVPYWVGKSIKEFEAGTRAMGFNLRIEVVRILFKGDPQDV